MRRQDSRLGAILAAFAVVARAIPQKGITPIFPIQNATRTPAPTDSSCEAACSVRYPEPFAISWVPEVSIVFTTEITIGTVSAVTMVSANSTLSSWTHTVYGAVPTEYDLYRQSTDDGGTAMLQVGLTLSDSYTFTQFTYPTPWLDYPSEYHWEGVLPTIGKGAVPACATATLELLILPQHPEYPQPEVKPDEEDPLGAKHQPLWVPVQDIPNKPWFDETFPLESAFAYCESVPGKLAPTKFSAAKFVFATESVITHPVSLGIIHHESTATGFEETDEPSGPRNTPDIPRIQSTASGWDQPDANQTPDVTTSGQPFPKNPTPNVPGVIASLINNNRPKPSAQPVVTPAPAPATPTPAFTLVPTVVNGRTTSIPAFVLPGSGATATVGQQVTVNGKPTVLSPPPTAFIMVSTIISGVATSTPVYIISGTSTATIGQAITLDGHPTILAAPLAVFTMIPTTMNSIATSVPGYTISGSVTAFAGQTVTIGGQATVLAAPDSVFTMISTTINGVATAVPAYIISGSITAFPGQTVTVSGQPTVLPFPDAVYTSISTTINGIVTVIPAYIISGSTTATLGQTVTLDGKTTILSTPTGTEGVDTRFGGPATTSPGPQSQETGLSQGTGAMSSGVSCLVELLAILPYIIMYL